MSSAPSIPNFNMDPVACLQALGNLATPTVEALPYLTAHVAASMKEAPKDPAVPLLYIRAAARHLPALAEQLASQTAAAAGQASLAAAAAVSGGPAALLLQHAMPDGSNNNSNSASSGHGDAQQNQTLNEICEALGFCAARCQPRSAIAETGILPVLEVLFAGKNTSNNRNNTLIWSGPTLSYFYVDLLQIYLYANRSAEVQRMIADTWPRPTAKGSGLNFSVVGVLRYYYLRGMMHMECQNWEWAVRCFWTCLCIPADGASSAIAVAGWKKLILLQSLLQSDRPPAEMTVMRTPKTIPISLSRFIHQAIHSNSSASPQGGPSNNNNNAKVPPPPPPGGDGMASVVQPPPEDAAATGPPLLHWEELRMADGAFVQAAPAGQQTNNNNNNSRGAPNAGVRAYSDLVQAFVKANRVGFKEVLGENVGQFAQDGNLALVRLVESELDKRQIYQWSRVFSVISLQRLSELLAMPQSNLQQLLTSFEGWNIRIDNGMVHFPKRKPGHNNNNSTSDFAAVADLSRLTEMMQKLDVAVSTSSRFMSLVRRDNSAAANPEGSKGAGPRGVEDV